VVSLAGEDQSMGAGHGQASMWRAEKPSQADHPVNKSL